MTESDPLPNPRSDPPSDAPPRRADENGCKSTKKSVQQEPPLSGPASQAEAPVVLWDEVEAATTETAPSAQPDIKDVH
jgi:hypothetical protein